MAKKVSRSAKTKVRLIESEEGRPAVSLTPGKRYEVVVASIVDSQMQLSRGKKGTP
jgi:hypothetical protein